MQVLLPCNAASPALARQFVLGALERDGKAGLGDVATLLVSELVTNAFLHAHSDVRVHVRCENGEIKIAVSDASTRPARPLHATSPATDTGRGLQLVEALADDWGSEIDGGGKTVWFSIGDDGGEWGT